MHTTTEKLYIDNHKKTQQGITMSVETMKMKLNIVRMPVW